MKSKQEEWGQRKRNAWEWGQGGEEEKKKEKATGVLMGRSMDRGSMPLRCMDDGF